jgi:DNA-binding MarR family transcriptional regulator
MDATRAVSQPHPDSVPAELPSHLPSHPPAGRPTETRLAVALQRLLVAAEDARRAMADRMELSENEVWAMQHVMGGPIGPVELARRLHMSSASATVLVDRLEQAGHVRRVPHPHDGRRRLVEPTDQGAAAVFEQVGPMLAGLAQAEAGLDPDQVKRVGDYLARVTQVLAQVADPGNPPAPLQTTGAGPAGTWT